MALEDEFNQAIERWIDYCRTSSALTDSSGRAIIDCEPYRTIVSMGVAVLPLVRETYDRDHKGIFELECIKGHALLAVVGEMVGEDFSVPKPLWGKVHEMEEYTKEWLDRNMNRYVSA